MNAADLARLALAKRAFQATQPGAAEVQTGVRRARLALDRAKPRRRWFSKGLVFVVLAVGSLAYAKPQALGELVEKVLPREPADAGKHAGRAPASARAENQAGVNAIAKAAGASAAQAAAAAPAATEAQRESRTAAAASDAEAPTPNKAAVAVVRAPASNPRPTSPAPRASAVSSADAPASTPTVVVSDWGRVGQALARGDDTGALAALDGLSESDDPRTRDKADLGRAQLLMAHGDQEKACAVARSLTHRRAGGRIERQAQLLLKSCTR